MSQPTERNVISMPEAEEAATAGRLVASLKVAQQRWSRLELSVRVGVIGRFRHLLAEEGDSIASAIASQDGRTAAEVISSEILPLAGACRFIEQRAVSILRPRKEGVRGRPLWLFGATAEISREPFGVVMIIAPSNYPLFLPGVQLLQALVAGNSVLLKPGIGGTRAAQAIIELLGLAGVPPGTIYLSPEGPEQAQAALEAGVDKLFFTGSAAVGRKVLDIATRRATPSVMELSGCDAVIVRADADLEMAVKALAFGLRLNKGRTCIAPKRVFVHRSIGTELEGRLSEELARTEHHRLPTEKALAAASQVKQALMDGAHLLAGETHPNGDLTLPMALCGVKPGSRLLSDDFFLPIISVVTVANDTEALQMCAQGSYGLGATIFSRDIKVARQLAAQLEVGTVVINDMIAPTADPRIPFVGRRLSGFGATRGPEGLLEMTVPKVTLLRKGRTRLHYDAPSAGDEKLFNAFLKISHAAGWRARIRALRDLMAAVKERNRSKQSRIEG